MKYLISFFFLFLSVSQHLNAQIHFNFDMGIEDMVSKSVSFDARSKIRGWRVQILAVTERAVFDKARQEFMSLYPDRKVDHEHEHPYYKLKVGAFLSKMDAMHLKYQLQLDYPDAYLIRDDNLTPKDLLHY